nr:amidohydrolase [Parahaliea mediterranea]
MGISMYSRWLVICGCLLTLPALAVEADYVLRGGAVYTVDEARPWASAVAVAGKRIVYVGDDTGAADYIGPATEVIDAAGKMVLPGFIDSHVHPIWGGKTFTEVNLGEAGSAADVGGALRRYREANPGARYITGGGWVRENFGESSPRREWIDAAVGDIPVLLHDHFGHTALANSAALSLAGVDASTPDPAGGHFERDPRTGEPTGLIHEDAAIGLVADRIVRDPEAAYANALKQALAYLNSNGITSFLTAYAVGDPLGQAFVDLYERGELSARTTLSFKVSGEVPVDALIPALRKRRAELERYDPAFIRADRAKLFLDGVVLSHTAAMLAPYAGEFGAYDSEGYLFDGDQLRRYCAALNEADFGLHFHTVGDGAARQALDAVAYLRENQGELARRPTISHLTVVSPRDYARFATLGVVANAQLFWGKHQEIIARVEDYLGPRRKGHIYPYGSIARAGGTLAAGSDWPVSTANPFWAMAVAATRPYVGLNAGGDNPLAGWDPATDAAWLPEHRVDVATMIRAYTIEGARLQLRDDQVGSLEVGKLADLVVVDRNILDIPVAQLPRTRVLLTMVDGRIVYPRPR